jgi:uncharacterized protein YciI
MQFLVLGFDKPGSNPKRMEVVDAHWDYMDRFEDAMIGRGPLLDKAGTTMIGSVHMLELDSVAAAHDFAHADPLAEAGVFREFFIKRWVSGLKRRQRDFSSQPDSEHYFVHGFGKPGMTETRAGLLEAHRAYFVPFVEPNFIFRGGTFSDDGETWTGSAMGIEMADRAALDAMFADEPYVKAGLYERMDIYRWRLGGRQNIDRAKFAANS